MDKNVYAAIQSQYATFSKVGKRIADHIIADPVHITSISIQQMAAELEEAPGQKDARENGALPPNGVGTGQDTKSRVFLF